MLTDGPPAQSPAEETQHGARLAGDHWGGQVYKPTLLSDKSQVKSIVLHSDILILETLLCRDLLRF